MSAPPKYFAPATALSKVAYNVLTRDWKPKKDSFNKYIKVSYYGKKLNVQKPRWKKEIEPLKFKKWPN